MSTPSSSTQVKREKYFTGDKPTQQFNLDFKRFTLSTLSFTDYVKPGKKALTDETLALTHFVACQGVSVM